MKIQTSLVLALVVSLLVPAPCIRAADFDPTGESTEAAMPRQIRVRLEYIELPLAEMAPLMTDPAAAKSDAVLREKLGKLVEAGRANIVAIQSVVARTGMKATSESIREFIYPTEYSAPRSSRKADAKNGSADGTPEPKPNAGPLPASFEARNLGSTLEIEATLADNNKIIDIRLAPEIVYFTGNTKWTTWKDEHGEADVAMPVFYTLRIHTALTVIDGRPCFVAALSPKDDQGRMDPSRKIMVFVTCNVVVAGR